MTWQQTIASSVTVEGVGYWSGKSVRVEFRPAQPGDGICFVRTDVDRHPRIPASVSYRIDTPRRTDLECDGVRVEMVEHVVASLGGLGIDNCEIHVTSAEMPGLDGSALAYAEALMQSGIVTQSAPRSCRGMSRQIRISDDTWSIEAMPSPSGNLVLSYEMDYGASSPIPHQKMTLEITPEVFLRELAPARTFLLEAEAKWLRQQGLGLHATERDLLVIGDHGPIDNAFRFDNECVRHKILDMVGDFTLAGCRLGTHIRACRTGHHHNALLVKDILNHTHLTTLGQPRRCA